MLTANDGAGFTERECLHAGTNSAVVTNIPLTPSWSNVPHRLRTAEDGSRLATASGDCGSPLSIWDLVARH